MLVGFAAQAEQRVALVIGNGAYAKATALANPARDAAAVWIGQRSDSDVRVVLFEARAWRYCGLLGVAKARTLGLP